MPAKKNPESKLKITLITNALFGTTYGVNIIVARLRQRGHRVQLFNLVDITNIKGTIQSNMLQEKDTPGCLEFSAPVVEQLLEMCKGSSLIGLSGRRGIRGGRICRLSCQRREPEEAPGFLV